MPTALDSVEINGTLESGITINAIGEAQPYIVIFVAPTEEAAAPILDAFDEFRQVAHSAENQICRFVNGQLVCGDTLG